MLYKHLDEPNSISIRIGWKIDILKYTLVIQWVLQDQEIGMQLIFIGPQPNESVCQEARSFYLIVLQCFVVLQKFCKLNDGWWIWNMCQHQILHKTQKICNANPWNTWSNFSEHSLDRKIAKHSSGWQICFKACWVLIQDDVP